MLADKFIKVKVKVKLKLVIAKIKRVNFFETQCITVISTYHVEITVIHCVSKKFTLLILAITITTYHVGGEDEMML